MENEAVTLYCPNEYCQAANPLTHKFCQRCSTPLPKRYLWAVKDGLSLGSSGEKLADRYLVLSKSVVLDIKPGLLPPIADLNRSPFIRAYLKLIPYRLNVPQVYGVISSGDRQEPCDILLLEKPPILVDTTNSTNWEIQLCQTLGSLWSDASSIRQINWLWQMANLWQPLLNAGVASSLLDPNLLRIEGSLIRLLELRYDVNNPPTLSQLGDFWQQLLPNPKPVISELLKQVNISLIQAEIKSSEQLIAILDEALSQLWQAPRPADHPTESKINIFTKTDTGPVRQRNEDACYPPSDTFVSKPPQRIALAIVCDGIGGHEGGNIASNLAIDTIWQQTLDLASVKDGNIDSAILLTDLETAIAKVNDKISQRNDQERRQGRQRMGTTLVMALPIAHEMYIAHVGDSRAYWITHQGCYQVTLDDDIASREVRLGYATYRDALQQPGAGSLVQALGMSQSNTLHPTAQRFIVDEDAVFLLTSDGLSDFDRVEDAWENEILPILSGEFNLASVGQRLIEIANTKNGHDNVTIALIHCQVKYSEPDLILSADLVSHVPSRTVNLTPGKSPNYPDPSQQKTQVILASKLASTISPLPFSFLVLLLVALASGSLGYLLMQWRWLPPNQVPPIILPASPHPDTSSQPLASNSPAPKQIHNHRPPLEKPES
jgi:protein phosphatase